MRFRHTLRRWHIWLGWIVGIPLLLWSVSGVVMVAKPIEEVRGSDLLSESPALPSGLVALPPAIGPRAVETLRLEQRCAGPRWVIGYADCAARLADHATGRLLPAITAAEAAWEIAARYTGKAKIGAVDRTSADNPLVDLRRPVKAWRVTMSDGTCFYLDAATGEILARRTRWWRFYDFLGGLHVMDLDTREDTHNPWVIGFGIVTLLTTLMALILLPMTVARRRRGT